MEFSQSSFLPGFGWRGRTCIASRTSAAYPKGSLTNVESVRRGRAVLSAAQSRRDPFPIPIRGQASIGCDEQTAMSNANRWGPLRRDARNARGGRRLASPIAKRRLPLPWKPPTIGPFEPAFFRSTGIRIDLMVGRLCGEDLPRKLKLRTAISD